MDYTRIQNRTLHFILAVSITPLAGCAYLIGQTDEQLGTTAFLASVQLPAPGVCPVDVQVGVPLWIADKTVVTAESLKLAPGSPGAEALQLLNTLYSLSGSTSELNKLALAFSPKFNSGSDPPTLEVHMSRGKIRAELETTLRIAHVGGFFQLATRRETLLREGTLTPSQTGILDKADFFSRYFEAYFRKGKLLVVGVDRAKAKVRLEKDLAHSMGKEFDQLSASDQKIVDAAVDQLLGAICAGGTCQLLDVGDADAAFVSRAGLKFAFPVITVNIAPGSPRGFDVTKIDEVAIVGDLTRLIVEATFDALQPKIPAIGSATGCSDPKLFTTCEKVADDKLIRINHAGDMAEGVGGYVAAQVTRGAWLVSLNNEAVAKLLSTVISVSLRKGAEVAVWAAQTCRDSAESLRMTTVRFYIEP
jgi:hypothetical protein